MTELSHKAKLLRYQILTMQQCLTALDEKINHIESGCDDGKLRDHIEYRKSVQKKLTEKEGAFAVETGTAVRGMHYNALLKEAGNET